MPVFTDILLGVEALTTGAGMFEKSQQEAARETQIEMRKTQENMRAIQQAERQQIKEVKTMSAQAADEAVTGFSPASPSFKAISKSSFDAFLNDENATALNNQFQQNMLDIQKDEAKKSKNASMFRLLSNFGLDIGRSYKTI